MTDNTAIEGREHKLSRLCAVRAVVLEKKKKARSEAGRYHFLQVQARIEKTLKTMILFEDTWRDGNGISSL